MTFAPLRKRGHSKEGRDNDPQVIIALAVTRDGMPVRSWVLPGDTADVTAVARIKEDLRQMRLGRALFVGLAGGGYPAKAGLYAKANLHEHSKGAGRYILATPIGRVKEIKDEVLSRPGRYAEITPNLRAKEVIVGEGERRRRYILCLNTEEAEREQRHRDELLDLLQLKLDSPFRVHPVGSPCRGRSPHRAPRRDLHVRALFWRLARCVH